MKRICKLLMAVVFLSVTAVSAQTATTSKKDAKTEVGQKLKKDGTADMRYKENKEVVQKEVKHLKKDGTPDKRYKENK